MRAWTCGVLALIVTGCVAGRSAVSELPAGKADLTPIAQFDHQWTGVTVAPSGRIFVNFPRWKDWPGMSVAELKRGGDGGLRPVAYPNEQWQQWQKGQSPREHFVCVQSVVADRSGRLWVVDAAAPDMGSAVPGGPKLVGINLANGAIEQIVSYAAPVIGDKSYLNDVRIDDARHTAYLTDSGMGGIVVSDLKTGHSWKALANSPTTHSEGTDVVINGKPWRRDGQKPDIHSDGIALSTDGRWLYYHALTGRTLYRVPTDMLMENHSDGQRESAVQRLGETGVCDGMWYAGGDGVYLCDPEKHAVTRFDVKRGLQIIVQSDQLQWPDTFSAGPDGTLYVTTSQIDTQPHPPGPYQLFRVTAGK